MLNATQSCKITTRNAVGIAEVDSRPETGEAIVGTRLPLTTDGRENIKIADHEVYNEKCLVHNLQELKILDA